MAEEEKRNEKKNEIILTKLQSDNWDFSIDGGYLMSPQSSNKKAHVKKNGLKKVVKRTLEYYSEYYNEVISKKINLFLNQYKKHQEYKKGF